MSRKKYKQITNIYVTPGTVCNIRTKSKKNKYHKRKHHSTFEVEHESSGISWKLILFCIFTVISWINFINHCTSKIDL